MSKLAREGATVGMFTRSSVWGLILAAASMPVAGAGVIRDLGVVQPQGISEAGQVVGLLPSTAGWPNGYSGTPELIDGKTGNRSTLDGRVFVAISPNGTVVTHDTKNAMIHQSDGSLVNAGELNGGYYGHSEPLAVNDSGTVVGYSRASMRDNHAFASTAGTSNQPARKVVDLGTFGGKNSAATAVNNAGTIVGQMDNLKYGAHAFSISASDVSRSPSIWGSYVPGTASTEAWDLGTLGGKNSTALAINELGQIVGASNIRDDQTPFTSDTSFGSNEAVHAFLYLSAKGMTDLGTLPGLMTSIATDINNLGQIVGYSTDTRLDLYHYYTAAQAYGNSRAFLYEDGKLSDLNDLLPLDSSWILKTALGINDAGQITGQGLYRDEERGYFFELGSREVQPSPVPEPTTLALFGAIAAGVLARRRKRV